MQRRVRQTLAVMLAVDGEQPRRDIPHDGGGGGHTVHAAAALALGVDLAVQKQVVVGFIAALFQLLLDRIRDTLKGRPDAGLLCAAAHQLTRCTVAQNGIDGLLLVCSYINRMIFHFLNFRK